MKWLNGCIVHHIASQYRLTSLDIIISWLTSHMINSVKVIPFHKFVFCLGLEVSFLLKIMEFGPQLIHVIQFFFFICLIDLKLNFSLLLINRAQNWSGITIISHIYKGFSQVHVWLSRRLMCRWLLELASWLMKLAFLRGDVRFVYLKLLHLVSEKVLRWNH